MNTSRLQTLRTLQTILRCSPQGPDAGHGPIAATRPDTAHAGRSMDWQGPDAARRHYLAEAIDARDLARRTAAWDRAQAIYRGR